MTLTVRVEHTGAPGHRLRLRLQDRAAADPENWTENTQTELVCAGDVQTVTLYAGRRVILEEVEA